MDTTIQKLQCEDGFTIEYNLLYKSNNGSLHCIDPRRVEALERIQELDNIIGESEERITQLDQEIDQLTCNADNLDYLLAVASGVLTGMIDVFFVGDLNMNDAKKGVHTNVNKFIQFYAKCSGYEGGDNDLAGAISFLEKKYPVAQDNSWSGEKISVGSKNHHLADLAHHPTLVGLLAAIIVQFFRTGVFVNRDGEWHLTLIETDPKELAKIWAPVFISAFLIWITNIAKKKYTEDTGKEIPKVLARLIKLLASAPVVLKLLSVASNWAGHLVSDMGGSKNTAGGGSGIPGLFISFLHELSSIPPLNYTKLPQIVNDLYTKNKIDLRTELAFASELGRQAVPVMINELIVRSFYFIRRLLREFGDYKSWSDVDWDRINWQNVIPFKNRTVIRMITIASGTFTVIDMADAGIRAMISSKGNPALFWSKFLIRVNFVGIGRFTVALATDLYMGHKRKGLIAERMTVRNYLMVATDAKVWYYDTNMWISAQEAGIALRNSYMMMMRFCKKYQTLAQQYEAIDANINNVLERKKNRIAILRGLR